MSTRDKLDLPERLHLKRNTLVIFLVWAALLVFSFGGGLYSTDVLAEYEVAESFLGARPLLTAEHGWTVSGIRSGSFVPHGIGYSIILMPAAAIGLTIQHEAGTIAVALTNAFLSLLFIVVLYRLAMTLSGKKTYLFRFLVVTISSMALVYGRMPFDVTAAALFCSLAVFFSLEHRDIAAGFAIGCAILIRMDSIVFLPVLINSRKSAIRLIPGIITAVLITAAANLYRFGSIIDDGHSQDPAMTLSLPFNGFIGLLFSPGKGLLWFVPTAFLAVFYQKGRWKYALPLILSIIMHSFLRDWSGGTGWGPRFLFPALPLFLLPLTEQRKSCRLFSILVLWTVLISVSAIWSHPCEIEQSLGGDDYNLQSRQAVLWNPSKSPLLHTVKNLGNDSPDIFAWHIRQIYPSAGSALILIQIAVSGGLFVASAVLYRRKS